MCMKGQTLRHSWTNGCSLYLDCNLHYDNNTRNSARDDVSGSVAGLELGFVIEVMYSDVT